MTTPRALRALALSLAAVPLLVGCSGTPTVSAGDVEDRISEELEAQVGQAPDDVSCPEDLTGEVGETMTCTLTAGEDELDVAVEVTSVDGSTVNFDIQVADEVS